MRLWSLALSLAAAVVACSDDGGSTRRSQRGIDPPIRAGDVDLRSATQAVESAGEDDSDGFDDWRPEPSMGFDDDGLPEGMTRKRPLQEPAPRPPVPGPSGPAPTTAGANDESAEEPARDLGAELTALLRPEACLDLSRDRVAPGGHVRIQVSAVVLPSGRLQGASAQVAGQPTDALHCLESQLEAGHLASPIEGAPVRIQGSVTMEVHGAPSPTSNRHN